MVELSIKHVLVAQRIVHPPPKREIQVRFLARAPFLYLGRPAVEHEKYMAYALAEARAAYDLGEVPIGAVIVIDGEVVVRAHNMKEQWKDATAHAEMVAIKAAIERLGHWRRLREAALYVTVEPCPMCAGAIVQSRIKTLVYGAADPKAGAVHSTVNLVQDPRFNHRVEVVAGVLEEECRELMQSFFRAKRETKAGE